MKRPCLICGRQLTVELEAPHVKHGIVHGGGYVTIEFGYGSRFDPSYSLPDMATKHAERIVSYGDYVEAFVCDDCFEERACLCRGVAVIEQTRYERVEEPEPPTTGIVEMALAATIFAFGLVWVTWALLVYSTSPGSIAIVPSLAAGVLVSFIGAGLVSAVTPSYLRSQEDRT